MNVELSELARMFPGIPDRLLAETKSFLSGVVVGDMNWAQAQNLGLDVQKQYGAQVERMLGAMNHDVNRQAPQHLARLLALLELCSKDFDEPKGFVWGRKSTTYFQDHKLEIDTLRHRLNQNMVDLETPIQIVTDIRGKFMAMVDELTVASMSCEYLAKQSSFAPEVVNVLMDRATSLQKTAALVKQQQAQSLANATTLDSLRDRIQEGVLISLPTWMANLASQPLDNDTQRFLIRDELRQIILRLKS